MNATVGAAIHSGSENEGPPEKAAASIKPRLVAFARELGFDLCRIARCDAPPHAREFRQWLRDGAHGEMGYMQRGEEQRCDPQLVLPGAQSLVALALNYFQGYAAHSGATTAGGKSTMLINERLGTWFFLAEILTTLALPPDEPVRDRCGSCTSCMTACPTGAITAPYKLNARRCISYLTIELKGAIPLELRPFIGERVFGCDDCLSACPWNRFAQVSRESAFAARESATAFALRDYLALDEAQFRNLFHNSPIKRIKRRGFLRNVCVALGNVGTPNDLPALEKASADPEPLIAEHAQWAIERIRAREAQQF
jgi:epoxyqueuosine reductase